MGRQKPIDELLEQHGFELVRQRKHKVYRNAEGLVFVRSSTPSDYRNEENSFRDLRRLLRKSGVSFERPVECRPTPVEIANTPIAEEASSPTEVVQTIIPEVPVTQPTPAGPKPLTKQEEKLLRRWERQYACKELRRQRVLEEIHTIVRRGRHFIHEEDCPLNLVAASMVEHMRGKGYQSDLLVVRAVATKDGRNDLNGRCYGVLLVRVNRYLVEPWTGAVWNEPRGWQSLICKWDNQLTLRFSNPHVID